jgi:hypothetical protein
MHGGVGLAVTRGQSGPRVELAWRGEPADLTDLGPQDRGEHRADTRNPQQRPVTRIGVEQSTDAPIEVLDLGLEGVDQV